ncbi:MAG: NAD(P)-dependent oxidoreductase [Parvibaculales bacterium]|nr:phosphoglycerate dehydrogenase [Alphaproteobacteria bacterium]
MTRKVAVFGQMGVNFAPIIDANFAAKQDDWQVVTWPCDDDIAARDAVLADCEAAVMSADFILTPGNFGALMAAPKLKILLQPWVGIDWLDAGFLSEGLIFCNAGGHAAPMAEYVMGAMLEHALELRTMHSDMLAGDWKRAGRNAASWARHGDLSGKQLGIVGYGEIAKAVAKRAAAFDMNVSAIARSKRDKAPAPLDWIGVQADLPKLLADSDYLILTCDLNEETEGMIDKAAFEQMKDTAYIVNVARGEVIDEDALYEALQNKHIAGAALDTWYRYPVNITEAEADPDRGGPYQGSKHDFNGLDNVLMTPHMSAHTFGADRGRYESIAESLCSYAEGEKVTRHVATGTGENLNGFAMP